MEKHVVQSEEWKNFKESYGTPAVLAGNVLYTKHKIPFTGSYFAYCPKVNPLEISFSALDSSLRENDCVSINFDVPNIPAGTDDENKALEVFRNNKCVKSPRDQFAKANILLSLEKTDSDLLAEMHVKHRYNIQYAQKKGVKVFTAFKDEDFKKFYTLLKKTADRQKYFVRQETYYKKLWDMFKPLGMAEILTAEYDGEPLASWMFVIYKDTIYYPYGGSSEEGKSFHGSNLVAWEGIKLGRERKCKTFDMWGASGEPDNKEDPWWGFTNFKMKFGGQYIRYTDSYDYILNEPVYRLFTMANDLRWRILRFTA